MRHLFAVVALAVTACECGEEPPAGDALDLSFLIGEGMFIDDVPTNDASADVEDSAVDTGGPDFAGPDLAPVDAAGPDLGPVDAGDPCSAPATRSLRADEARRELDSSDGAVILVTGAATAGAPACTELPCDGGGICCNTCRAEVLIDGVLPLITSGCVGTATVGCAGGACGPLVCTPPALGIVSGYVGRLQAQPTAGLVLLRVEP